MIKLKDCPVEILQNEWEVNKLINEVIDCDPLAIKNVLEIGSFYGGSLWCWAEGFIGLNKLMSIDKLIPSSDGRYDKLMESRAKWPEIFKDVPKFISITEDSKSKETIDRVKQEFPDGIDFLFIDGDHSYEGCMADFKNYLPLMSKGGVIALHDINHECKKPWQEIKINRKILEISEDGIRRGIGVIYV
jgi:cephalosporin hydroxylase